MNSNKFKCPFEEQGEKRGTIREVLISDAKDTTGIGEGIYDFVNDSKWSAARITLPNNLKKAGSNEALLPLLLPYTIEILASTLEAYFGILSPNKLRNNDVTRDDLNEFITNNPELALIFLNIKASINSVLGKEYDSNKDLRDLLYSWFTSARMGGLQSPSVSIQDSIGLMKDASDRSLVTLGCCGGIKFPVFYVSKEFVTAGKKYDNDTFSITTTPFYPEQFGRYSNEISIVITRMSDFLKLPSDFRRKIRAQSNQLLLDAGINISHVEEDMQPGGLWIS